MVTSGVPEEGKSTVALFLALASAASGRRTLLIECDLRRPVLAERLAVPDGPGLSDFVAGKATREEIVHHVSAMIDADAIPPLGAESHDQTLACVFAGAPTRQAAEILESERFVSLLGQFEEAYDVVVIDTPPLLAVVDALDLIPRASAVLVCARASRTTRDQVRATRAALDRLPERPTGLVITGTTRADAQSYGYYAYR